MPATRLQSPAPTVSHNSTNVPAPFGRVVGSRIDIGATERKTIPNLNLVVDTLADESDGDHTAGHLSLREAIGLANGSIGSDSIRFAGALTSAGPAAIYLTLGVLIIDDSAVIQGPGGNLLTIDGSRNAPSRSATDKFVRDANAFNIMAKNIPFSSDIVEVELSGLTVIEFPPGQQQYGRAAISSSAHLTITGCTISNNFGTGIFSGDIPTFGFPNAELHIVGSTISGNHQGGVSNFGTGTIASSTISGNSSDIFGDGGGIVNFDTLTVTDSAITDNFASNNGGGIDNTGTLNLTNVTISGNHAAHNGGGIYSETFVPTSTSLFVNHTTITSNMANLGGGLFFAMGSASLRNSIVAANNQVFFSAAPDIAGLLGTVINTKYCLIGVSTGSGLAESPNGSPDKDGNIVGRSFFQPIDPKLGPLAIYGGKVMTMPLLVGSPAIDAGDPAAIAGANGVPQFDERGTPFGRVFGGRIDIGAFEYRPTLAGDYNFNGIVDAADYTVWRDTLGSTTDLRADASGPTVGTPNGIIDQADYDFWKSHVGNTLAGAAATTSAPPSPPSWHQPLPIRIPKSQIRNRRSPLAPRSSPLSIRNPTCLFFTPHSPIPIPH